MKKYTIIATYKREVMSHEIFEVTANTREDAIGILKEYSEFGDNFFDDYIKRLPGWEEECGSSFYGMKVDGEDSMQMDIPRRSELFEKYKTRIGY